MCSNSISIFGDTLTYVGDPFSIPKLSVRFKVGVSKDSSDECRLEMEFLHKFGVSLTVSDLICAKQVASSWLFAY